MQHLKWLLLVVFATIVVEGRFIRPVRERKVLCITICWVKCILGSLDLHSRQRWLFRAHMNQVKLIVFNRIFV